MEGRRGVPLSNSRSGGAAWFLVIAAVAVAIFQTLLIWTGPAGEGMATIQERVLLDTDSYMWLNRVTHMVESGGWFDHDYPRVNPPEGHVQHWTRPLDAILLAGGAVLGTVVGFEDGLYFWGFFLSPLLHIATLLALAWAVRVLVRQGLLDQKRLPLLYLVFLAQLPIYQTFLAGRPDHHAPLALLFVLYLGFWMRVLLEGGRGEQGNRAAIGLGLVAALAIWVNMEALLYIVMGMVGLGLSWFFGNLRLARATAVHSTALAFGVVAAVGIEWGPTGPPIREMDTLSVAHVVLFALTAGFWWFLWGASRRKGVQGIRERTAVAGLGTVGVLGPLLYLFPEFAGSPLGEVDPLYHETRLTQIVELQPLASLGPEGPFGGFASVVLMAGTAFLALPYLGFRLFRASRVGHRILWGFFAALVGLFLGLSLAQARWSDYLALSTVIPYTVFAAAVVARLAGALRGRALRLVRPFVLLILILGHAIMGIGLGLLAPEASDPEGLGVEWVVADEGRVQLDSAHPLQSPAPCSVREVASLLNDAAWFTEPELILAHTDYGPELLYRTGHSVLSIPNHRPQPGYSLTHEVMGHSDPDAATALLAQRGVEVVILCRNDIESGFFRYPGTDGSFADWLAGGGVPEGYSLHTTTPSVKVFYREGSDLPGRG